MFAAAEPAPIADAAGIEPPGIGRFLSGVMAQSLSRPRRHGVTVAANVVLRGCKRRKLMDAWAAFATSDPAKTGDNVVELRAAQ
jgi:hypothetical protein